MVKEHQGTRVSTVIISICTNDIVCKAKGVLEGWLEIVAEAGFSGLKLQSLLLHSLLLVGILVASQGLGICKFLEAILALKLLDL